MSTTILPSVPSRSVYYNITKGFLQETFKQWYFIFLCLLQNTAVSKITKVVSYLKLWWTGNDVSVTFAKTAVGRFKQMASGWYGIVKVKMIGSRNWLDIGESANSLQRIGSVTTVNVQRLTAFSVHPIFTVNVWHRATESLHYTFSMTFDVVIDLAIARTQISTNLCFGL